jgi:acetyl esterase/lipase
VVSGNVVSWLFLAVSCVGAGFTYNAFRPMRGTSRRAFLSFVAGWLTTELALHHIAWQALAVVVFVWAGALEAWPGVLGLAITLVSWAMLVRCWWIAHEAEAAVEQGLRAGLGDAYREDILPAVRENLAPTIDWRQLLLPFPIRHPEVERVRNIPYARVGALDLRLDVYRHRSCPSGCPTLLQVHGGAWVVGSKNEQGVPLMVHLASRGWVCVSADYRLSPRATFPDHLVDLKRAVRWIREHGAEYGADPDFLVVTGGSAGGHLAALLALTANDPEYQPGFEHADTAVRGCVAFYGVYDFTDRHRVWTHDGLLKLLERRVMKVSLATAREVYEKASPISRIRAGAPPFFVIHGTNDTMVPVEEARRFCDAFREVTGGPIVYAEIPGAQHAFELLPSLRTTFVIHGVERFLAYLYSRYVAEAYPASEVRSEPAAVPARGTS